MDYIIVALLGMAGGAFCVFMLTEGRRKALGEQKRAQEEQSQRIAASLQNLTAREERYDQVATQLKAARAEFDARAVPYKELQDENTILKRDLRNIIVQVRKVQLDTHAQRQSQETVQQKVQDIGSRYLKENVKWLGASLTPNNFSASNQRLKDVIDRCRGIGFEISAAEEESYLSDLKEEYKLIVRAAFEREEQARIKAQIREEQLREREIERELKQLEHEREAIKAALEKALAEAKDQHSEEVQRLQARLTEAEEKARRAISQAQLTKSGHVYVISNIGSFGEGIFKVGMTRRQDPNHRILELGSASVPFPFDVHMMISSNDAPALETALHRKLFKLRMNKTNPRKEFFKTDIASIYQVVKEHHGEIEYLADAEALQYRQSLTMTDEDQQFVESVYNSLEEEEVLDEA
jgi:Meiotically Up-regulated Gene 113 (MUG113) protein